MGRNDEPQASVEAVTVEPAPEEGVEADAEGLLELVLSASEARAEEAPPSRIDGVLIGRLVAIDAEGRPLVDYPGCASAEGIAARAMAALGEADVGREAALLFEGGDPKKPVLMGLMHVAAAQAREPAPARVSQEGAEARVDGERVVFSAEKEIVFECGQASITLTRAGKILIKGAYVLTRSSGVNRIQGGSVQIN
jgi:hypothetical protein